MDFFFFDQTRIEYYFGEIILISINSGFTINTDLYNITPCIFQKYTWVILYRLVLIVNPNWQSRSKLFSASSLASLFFFNWRKKYLFKSRKDTSRKGIDDAFL